VSDDYTIYLRLLANTTFYLLLLPFFGQAVKTDRVR
jgi:hypothetical protein